MTDSVEPPTVTERLLNSLMPGTHVKLYPLAMQIEDEQYIVGRMETGEFVALPEVGGRIIELFQRGCSLGEAQTQLQEEYGAEVALDEFVTSLVDLGFVETLDGYPLGSDDAIQPNLGWLQPHHVRWLFSWPVRVLYGALLLAAGYALVTHIELVPRYQDFFWSTVTSVVVAVNTAMFVVNAILHEMAHLVAARSLGVPAHFSLGTRLHNLVAQTDVTGIWAVPRNQRYRVYLAGMLWDLIPMSVAVLLLAYVSLPALAQDLLRSLILLNFFGVVGQFNFYMRTDVYFVVLNLLRCHNMFEDALSYLRYCARRLWFRIFPQVTGPGPSNPLDSLLAHERWKVSLYAWLVLFGSTVSLTMFAVYGLPLLVELFVQAGASVWRGITLRQLWPFLDGVVTLLVEGSFQVGFVIIFLRNHRHWFSSLRQVIGRR